MPLIFKYLFLLLTRAALVVCININSEPGLALGASQGHIKFCSLANWKKFEINYVLGTHTHLKRVYFRVNDPLASDHSYEEVLAVAAN